MLDADGSMDPREIPMFVHALTHGADLVKGSRFLRGGGTLDMPLFRKLGNGCFVGAVRLLFGGTSTDLCYGYSAFWARILPQLRLDAPGFEIETQMALRARWAGPRVAEVPSFEARRVHGSSNLRTIPGGWRVIKQILRERFRSPIPRGSATIARGQRVVGIPVVPESRRPQPARSGNLLAAFEAASLVSSDPGVTPGRESSALVVESARREDVTYVAGLR